MNIGTNIEQLLIEQGISRKDFAQQLHIDYSTLCGYIRNRRQPDCETILRMSILLNTSIDFLFGCTAIPYPKDLHYTETEGILVSNFRSLSPDMQQLLIRVSICMPRSITFSEQNIWK